MAIIKCKMCGGDVEIAPDKTFGTCEYCGSTMTFPKVDDDQRAAAFNRGNHFRRIGEFDKALQVYERIVREDEKDAEAHWCCALCRFGIEYVEDPASFEYIPTCHRASFDNFLEDVDYLAAVEHSDGITRRQYQKDGAKIAEVQRGILATSQNEEPYDVFICYKETDENGDRTRDSAMAQDIYYQLTEQGRRVFFARITLEDKVGTEYEPYIFAALHSARVMVVVGTSAENLNAVWVKNEWSRFLTMMKHDRNKLLLPCYRDMDPYDLPDQLGVLQSYDMSKIGFIQDLTRGISKVLDSDKQPELIQEGEVVQNNNGSNIDSLLDRGMMALEDGEWDRADDFFEEVLNQNSRCAEAYLGKFLSDMEISSLEQLVAERIMNTGNMAGEKRELPYEEKYIGDKVSELSADGIFTEEELYERYQFDRSYTVYTPCKRKLMDDEKNLWTSNKEFLRFIQFASHSEVEHVQKLIQSIYSAIEQSIGDSEVKDQKTLCSIQKSYQIFLEETTEKIKKESNQALLKYESICRELQKRLTYATDLDELKNIHVDLKKLKEYKKYQEFEGLWRDKYEEIKEIQTEKQRRNYRIRNGVCQYCGGSFHGILIKKCIQCGRKKDY